MNCKFLEHKYTEWFSYFVNRLDRETLSYIPYIHQSRIIKDMIAEFFARFEEYPSELEEILFNENTLKIIDDYVYNVLLPHKWEVFKAFGSLKIAKPYNDEKGGALMQKLIKRLVFHDLSKFSIVELIGYSHHNRNEIKTDLDLVERATLFQLAWNHHINHNSHHPEYHTYYHRQSEENVTLPMTDLDILEMICDWEGASQTYGGKMEEWIPQNIDTFLFHPKTREKLDAYLRKIFN